MKLRYFEKDVQLTKPPRVENHPEPLERIEGARRDFLTYTEQAFIFDTKDERTFRVCRNATDKPLRDDPPIEIRGHRGAKTPLEDPKGYAVALYADGTRESVFVTACRNPYGNTTAPALSKREDTNTGLENIADKIMLEYRITRPQAVKIVKAMINMNATSKESAKPEKAIMKTAGMKSRIVSVFSDRSGDAKNYGEFKKHYIKNTGTRDGLYYLKLS